MHISEFDFDLPEEQIATHPVEPRDTSRLLYVGKERGTYEDLQFQNIADLVREGDVMVFNDTKVIPARLYAKRGEAKIQIMLHRKLANGQWSIFAKPAKKLKISDEIIFSAALSAIVVTKHDDGEVILEFNLSDDAFNTELLRIGEVPLPPYIINKRHVEEEDAATYQTVFAKESGAVAAPTAGLHYTQDILKQLDEKGVIRTHITLHVGGGTFLPVKTQSIHDHKMHFEYYSISEDTANLINNAKKNGGRVIAVGTTSLRALESCADENGVLKAESKDTDIFITPGYNFKIVDVLQTNFHIPKSTLFMLVCAFCGVDNMKHAYQHAIKSGYRFYSYGDTCFLEENTHTLPTSATIT